MPRFRPDHFFDQKAEERENEVQLKRAGRVSGLEVRLLATRRGVERYLVWSPPLKGRDERFYYVTVVTGKTTEEDTIEARCYCLDASRGNDRCKHVMATLSFRGEVDIRSQIEALGESAQVRTLVHKDPVGRLSITRCMERIEKGEWDWSDTAHTSWVLSHAGATEKTWELVATRADSMMAILGLLRDKSRLSEGVVGALLERSDLGDAEHATVCGLLLPWVTGKAFDQCWDKVRAMWLDDNYYTYNAQLVAQILRSGGAHVTRAIPKDDLLKLFKHPDEKVRSIMLRSLRTAGGVREEKMAL